MSAVFFAGKWSERGRDRLANGLSSFENERGGGGSILRFPDIHPLPYFTHFSPLLFLQISSVSDAGRIGEDPQPEHAEDVQSAAPPQARLRSSE